MLVLLGFFGLFFVFMEMRKTATLSMHEGCLRSHHSGITVEQRPKDPKDKKKKKKKTLAWTKLHVAWRVTRALFGGCRMLMTASA